MILRHNEYTTTCRKTIGDYTFKWEIREGDFKRFDIYKGSNLGANLHYPIFTLYIRIHSENKRDTYVDEEEYLNVIEIFNKKEFRDYIYSIPFFEELLGGLNYRALFYSKFMDALEPPKASKTTLLETYLDYNRHTQGIHEYAAFCNDESSKKYCVGIFKSSIEIFNVCNVNQSGCNIVDFEKFQEILFLENNVGNDLRDFLRCNHFVLLNVKKIIIEHLIVHHNKKYDEAVHITNTEYLGKVLSKKKV